MTKVNLFLKSCALIYAALLSAISGNSFAQNIEISGYVLDEATNKPVIGANVFFTNEKTGANPYAGFE
jgi:hypothetical protein